MEDHIYPPKNKNEDNFIYILNKSKRYTGKIQLDLKTAGNNANFISYSDIIYGFIHFLREKQKNPLDEEEEEFFYEISIKNIIYDYIGYFNGEEWIFLKEGEIILLNNQLTLNNIKIMIEANIISDEKIHIKKTYNNIDKEINSIKTELKDFEKLENNSSKKIFYSIILTANPIMDGDKELRTMNDFNIIPATIFNLFNEENYLKYTQFGILTKESFKKAISEKSKGPLILHLICKSTYIIPDNYINLGNKESFNFINLLFEQENNYNSEFIDKEKLDQIFSEQKIKENIKNITLIISTQLSGDVYDIFENYGFKNIIVQHTTLADIDYVAKLNSRFYENLILNRISNLNNIYEDAINVVLNNHTTFCCCFHKHKINCHFLKYIKNEIYNDNHPKSLDTLKINVPHFCHLQPNCPENRRRCNTKIDFCNHWFKCIDCFEIKLSEFSMKKIEEMEKEEKTIFKLSTCCCYDEDNGYNIIHNVDNIFNGYKYFSNANINDNNINNNNINIDTKNKFIPKYEKIILLVGNNKNALNLIQFFNSSEQYLYIYGDNLEKIKLFIDIAFEYYKERYYLNSSEEKEEIECLILNENNINIFHKELRNNITYFILIHDINFLNEIKKWNYKTIFCSEEKIDDKTIDKTYKIIKLNKDTSGCVTSNIQEENEEKKYFPNYYIKYQHKTDIRNIWLK